MRSLKRSKKISNCERSEQRSLLIHLNFRAKNHDFWPFLAVFFIVDYVNIHKGKFKLVTFTNVHLFAKSKKIDYFCAEKLPLRQCEQIMIAKLGVNTAGYPKLLWSSQTTRKLCALAILANRDQLASAMQGQKKNEILNSWCLQTPF